MHRSTVRSHKRAAELDKLFGSSAELAARVLDEIESEPDHRWQPQELVDVTGTSILDVMMIVARLTAAELVTHDGIGSGYRAMTR